MARETSSRAFLTNIFNSLSPRLRTGSDTSNPLANAGEDDRKLLLALHVLFPNEFLPALDLLDRRLVTRSTVRQDQKASDVPTPGVTVLERQNNVIYHVRSAQQKPSSSRFHDPVTASYEVRLAVWNCSCPAFAFAAFPPALDDPEAGQDDAVDAAVDSVTAVFATARTMHTADSVTEGDAWSFGGLTIGDSTPPACKHLLACVLVDKCAMFQGFVHEDDITVEQAAGLVAGWVG